MSTVTKDDAPTDKMTRVIGGRERRSNPQKPRGQAYIGRKSIDTLKLRTRPEEVQKLKGYRAEETLIPRDIYFTFLVMFPPRSCHLSRTGTPRLVHRPTAIFHGRAERRRSYGSPERCPRNGVPETTGGWEGDRGLNSAPPCVRTDRQRC